MAGGAFLLGLVLVTGLDLFRSADSFRLGLPHFVAALFFSGAVALAFALRERALAVQELARLADELADIITKMQTC